MRPTTDDIVLAEVVGHKSFKLEEKGPLARQPTDDDVFRDVGKHRSERSDRLGRLFFLFLDYNFTILWHQLWKGKEEICLARPKYGAGSGRGLECCFFFTSKLLFYEVSNAHKEPTGEGRSSGDVHKEKCWWMSGRR